MTFGMKDGAESDVTFSFPFFQDIDDFLSCYKMHWALVQRGGLKSDQTTFFFPLSSCFWVGLRAAQQHST